MNMVKYLLFFFFGPLIMVWVTACLKACYNILVHNNIWSKKR